MDCIPWLILLLLPFSVANSSVSAFFRVFPCHSVANSSASPTVAYASGSDFRVFPCSSVANSSASAFFRVFPCHSVAKMSFLLLFRG